MQITNNATPTNILFQVSNPALLLSCLWAKDELDLRNDLINTGL